MRNRLINLHTSGETKPIGLLNPGEIAIQHSTPENSRIYIDTATDSTNSSEATIVEFVPKSYMDKEIQRVMELIGNSSGDTGNTGSTIDKSDYICDDPNANPIEIYNGYKFSKNITKITPCKYDFSKIKYIDTSLQLPTGLTSITANMESLLFVEPSTWFNDSEIETANLYMPNFSNGLQLFYANQTLKSFKGNLYSILCGSYMFYLCKNLTSFTSDLSSLIDGSSMFRDCSKLTSWNIDLPMLTNGNNMFYGCTSLTSFTSNLSSLTNGYEMFSGCNSLTNVTLSGSLNCNSLSFSGSLKLTVDSLVNIINVLVDRTGQDGYTLRLGSTNLAKLSEEQKAVATNKNWTLM